MLSVYGIDEQLTIIVFFCVLCQENNIIYSEQ